MLPLKAFLYVFGVGASVFLVLNQSILTSNQQDLERILETDEPYFGLNDTLTTTAKALTSNHAECRLPKLDPWDPMIKRFLDSSKDPRKNCKPKFHVQSYVLDGIVKVNRTKNTTDPCFYRCLHPVDDRSLKFDKWLPIDDEEGAAPQCDVFDVQCGDLQKPSYKFLHQQIFERTVKKSPADPNAADIHLIIIDSVSTSQFVRSMPQTEYFLRRELDAVHFPYLNKVGLNSRPNAYAFFLGERAMNLPANPWGEYLGKGRGNALCKKSLNTENFIGFDYNNNGYRTLMNEDWAIGIFNWPNCLGFTKSPVDHFMKPFALRVDGSKKYKDKELRSAVYKHTCHESHDYMLELMEEFANKYPNEPKFSINWLTDIAHDDMNGLYHVDTQMKDFFNRIKDRLQNSFLIFMADHGGRTGKVRNTPVGEIEDHNPFFMISVPQRLRGNKDLMYQLRKNSKELITHYDLYATFLELATENHKWTNSTSFTDRRFTHPTRELKGSSLFHPLKTPRDCNSLLIPFNYCLCQHDRRTIQNSEIWKGTGKLMVEKMNKDVKASEYASKCAELRLDESFGNSVEEFNPISEKETPYLVKIKVQPSGGLYEAYVMMRNGTLELVTQDFARIDMYKEQTKCIPENFIRNYCFCNDLLAKSHKKREATRRRG
ncbi:unnamed protein product [Bursaphelenchus xylophilus]|uniref:(pine wood nematode) hypothetical protein n=1 Tax=Bursaphelenchus xylophilus TaxID=6326 RepID=A0A1I7S5M8_BURXY|nr:unnamed protein product [Bursaphelenchus xylophilus]CAG9124880.1 unnamed protein product [Bursaphelenchus xylophilus]